MQIRMQSDHKKPKHKKQTIHHPSAFFIKKKSQKECSGNYIKIIIYSHVLCSCLNQRGGKEVPHGWKNEIVNVKSDKMLYQLMSSKRTWHRVIMTMDSAPAGLVCLFLPSLKCYLTNQASRMLLSPLGATFDKWTRQFQTLDKCADSQSR